MGCACLWSVNQFHLPPLRLLQSAIDTIQYVQTSADGNSVAQSYLTFKDALKGNADKAKMLASQEQWQEFIEPYMNLPAAKEYTVAMAACVQSAAYSSVFL